MKEIFFWHWHAINADTRIQTQHSKDVEVRRTTWEVEQRELKDDIKTEEKGEQAEVDMVSEKQN